MSRVKSKNFWDKHIADFQKSGMSQVEYCRTNGLKHRSLQYHLHKNQLTRSMNPKSLEKHSRWQQIEVVDEPATVCTGGIRFQISRITIEVEKGFDTVQLSNVLRAADASC